MATREREKTLDRQIRAFQWIRALTALPGRLAGSAAERDAAGLVAGWLEELGFEQVRALPAAAAPRPGLVLGLHLAAGALAIAWGGAAGALLAFAAFFSLRAEQRGGRRLSAVLAAPRSVNVVARAGAREPRQRVVLSARLDVAQAGRVFSEPVIEAVARRLGGRPLPDPRSAARGLIAAAVLLGLADAAGAGGVALGTARWAVGGLCLAGAVAALEWGLAAAAPGANDNASGVAALLTCAEQVLAGAPEDVEVWVVAAGAGAAGATGMADFCDGCAHWPRDASYFVDFECVGGGALCWVERYGAEASPPLLRELARRVAEGGAFGPVEPARSALGSGGAAPAARGFASLSLVDLEPHGLPRRYHRTDDVAEFVDPASVVRAADFGAAVAVAAARGEAGPIAIL